MADSTVADLTAASALDGTELYYAVQGGVDTQVTGEQIRTLAAAQPQQSKSAAYTTVLADAGKHILHPLADNNARIFTIASNANVAYPIGTVLTFVNQINTLTIAITSDTLTLADDATTGSVDLGPYGIATAIKLSSTLWIISGTGITSFESETSAWVAAVVGDGGSVSDARKTLVNTLIAGLKTDLVFSKLDRLWLFAAENSQSALRDLVAAAVATASVTPTFTADAGYLGNGTTQYIDTNFNPTTASSPKFVRDSSSLFAYSNTSTGLTGAIFGITNGAASNANLFPRYTDDNFYGAVNEGTFSSVASLDAKGFWAGNRSAAGATQYYKNGSSIKTDTNASVAVDNHNFYAFTLANGAPWAGIALAVGFGQSLTAGEHLLLYGRLHTYMQTVAGVA